MKKVFLILALLLPAMAEAQTSRNPCYTTGAQTTQGIPNCIGVGTTTPLPVTTSTIPGSPLDVEGNVAAGVTDSGAPVKIGGVFNTTLPTYTNGQRGDIQITNKGIILNETTGSQLTGVDGFSNAQLGFSPSAGNLATILLPATSLYSFNGASWDRSFTCNNSAVVNVTAGSTTEIVPLTASQIIRVCSMVLTISATGTSTISYGTGTNCGTGNTALTGAMALATATPLTMSSGFGSFLRTASANALCVTAATGNVTGFITYAKY